MERLVKCRSSNSSNTAHPEDAVSLDKIYLTCITDISGHRQSRKMIMSRV